MITFSKYTGIVQSIAKKLKVSKDQAVNALIKAQAKGIDPLKWQKHMTMLKQFVQIVAHHNPVQERTMTSRQKLVQMQHYWDALSHLASDDTKKKSMKSRFGLKNIKLDRSGKLIDFDEDIEEDRDYKDEYKKFQSSEKMKKYRAELNKYNRKRGTYGNGDGKDASHKGGKIVGMEDESTNRGRAEKSRLVGSKRK